MNLYIEAIVNKQEKNTKEKIRELCFRKIQKFEISHTLLLLFVSCDMYETKKKSPRTRRKYKCIMQFHKF